MRTIKKSGFRFSDPRIKKSVFQVNDNFEASVYDGSLPTAYHIECSEIVNNRANVELTVVIGKMDSSTPFYINLTICAEFTWTNEFEKLSESLLKQNAVMLLMSYARPFIAHMTGDAGYMPFNLPFVDLSEDIEEM